MKIKITNKEQEIEGKIEKAVVKPTGTSAHIPFSKQHMAKHVSIIIPTNPFYSWILSDVELYSFFSEAKKVIEKENGKLAFHRLECLERIRRSKFSINDLIKICDLLEGNKKLNSSIKKIRGLYNIN